MKKQSSMVCVFILILIIFSPGCGTANVHDGWQSATPIEAGLNPELLTKLHQDIKLNKFVNLHSVLIVKKGKLVFEAYANGFSPSRRQYIASVTKSVGSIMVGIAMDRGYLPSITDGLLEKPLGEIFPRYKTLIAADAAKKSLNFHHVLTMSAGLHWDEHSHPYSDSRNHWNQAQRSDDPVKFLLQKPMTSKPGSSFYYNGALSIMMSHLVAQGTGRAMDKLADKCLFTPLGITDYRWERLDCGLTDTAGGLHMLPRDMAKIGLLVLNKGKWQGEQIVSSQWVERSTRMHMEIPSSPDYGYQWWGGAFYFDNRQVPCYFASGHGGQGIQVFAEQDMVVVITQQVFNNPFNSLNRLALLSNYILPSAFPQSLAKDLSMPPAKELEKYTGRYRAADGEFRCYLEKGILYLEESRNPRLSLKFLGGNRFYGIYGQLLRVNCTFQANEAGEITGMISSFGFRKDFSPKNNLKKQN